MMKNKKPVIRFKGFSEEWEEKELGKVANFIKGRGYSKNDIVESGTPIVLYGRLYTNYQTVIEEVDTFALKQKGSVFSNGNEVIVPASGETAEDIARASAIIKSGVLLGGDLNIIYPNEEINSIFLAIAISNGQTQIELSKKAQGKSVVHLRIGDLEKVGITYPNKTEQTQIGNFFKNLDNLITLHQRKYEKLGVLKKAMLEKMFPKNGANVPEIRFKGFEGAWEEKTLGELANFSKGQGYSKNDLTETGSPIILYGRLYTKYQTIISDVDTFVSPKNGSILSRGNEVLVPASGESAEDIARASAVAKSGILLGGDLNIIYPSASINPVFLALTISFGKPQKELSKKAQGKSVVHLRNTDLKEVDIKYPNIEEQAKISTYFKSLDDLLRLHEKELEKLKNLKKALLEKMFV